jgi:hypothetical protein
MSAEQLFYRVLTDAINDLTEYGFDSQKRLDEWVKKLAVTARQAMVPESVVLNMLRDQLGSIYRRLVDRGGLKLRHKGISEYTLAAIKPKLHMELERRILASANLIKLNRESSIARTLQRFTGWATSIPPGGTDLGKRRETKMRVRKGVASLPFEERRVIVDQGHKLVAAIQEIVATDGGAIGGVWHSHWREAGYDYREDHKERDGKFFVLRDNWAIKRGFMKLAGAKYLDEVTAPAVEPFCRCYMTYAYSLRDLPKKMLTVKGRDALAAARAKIGANLHAYGAVS